MSNQRASKRRGKNAPGRGRRTRWLAGGAAGLLFAAIAGFWAIGLSGGEGGPTDFAMVAYQGQDVLGGDEPDFRDVVGQGTPLVLNFWAASCPPCREEMPGFQRVHDEMGDDFIMLGVDIGPFVRLGTHEGARAFLAEYGIDYPAAYAVSADVVQDYEVRGMPTTVFFDGDGRMVNKHTGYMPEAQLRRELEGLLASAE
ncbi:MAG: TlpA disulfide reductase family protein [Trueperaceae bacterium]|nr:TlpA disulfide reductase family protein [Trueperaceae bacterium]